jgi:hypothetical protein
VWCKGQGVADWHRNQTDISKVYWLISTKLLKVMVEVMVEFLEHSSRKKVSCPLAFDVYQPLLTLSGALYEQ